MPVSKIIKSSNCSITFFPSFGIFQDPKMGRKTTVKFERGGDLYNCAKGERTPPVAPYSLVANASKV